MSEARGRAAEAERGKHAVVRDPTQRQDRAQLHHFGYGVPQEFPAVGNFQAARLVLGRNTAHRVGDAAIEQDQAVIGSRFVAPGGEAIALQGLVEQVAGVIAGKGPAGAVGAPQARRQSGHEQTCLARTE